MEKSELSFKTIYLGQKPGEFKYDSMSYNLEDLPSHFVVVKVEYAGIGPYDVNILTHFYPTKHSTLGFEGVGEISYAGKDLDQGIIGKKVAFCAIDSFNRSFSEYCIVSFQNCFLLDENSLKSSESYKQKAYSIGNPFTVKALFMEPIANHNNNSFVLDTANSSFGKIVLKLAEKNGIKVIGIVRREDAKKQLLEISKQHIIINSSDNDFLSQLKSAIETLNPTLYISMQGGSLPAKVFELLPRKSEIVFIGNIDKQPLSGFSTSPFIFQQKKISGWSVFDYFKKIVENKTFQDVGKEILENSEYEIELNPELIEFSLSDFSKALEFYELNLKANKGKILLKP